MRNIKPLTTVWPPSRRSEARCSQYMHDTQMDAQMAHVDSFKNSGTPRLEPHAVSVSGGILMMFGMYMATEISVQHLHLGESQRRKKSRNGTYGSAAS